jgi:hypothetical protein
MLCYMLALFTFLPFSLAARVFQIKLAYWIKPISTPWEILSQMQNEEKHV